MKGRIRTATKSELLDGGLVLQQNGDIVADRINPFALVAFEAIFAAHYQGLAANRTGENFQQVGRDHNDGNSNSAAQGAKGEIGMC